MSLLKPLNQVIANPKKKSLIAASPARPKKMRGRGLLRGEPMEVFKEGIWLVLNSWWEIRCFDKREIEIGGNPDPKVVQLRYYLFHWFIQSTGNNNNVCIHTYIHQIKSLNNNTNSLCYVIHCF